MPDWRDRLTRAAWRGMEFLTDSHETRGGRRLAVHQFPGAEAPAVEDLGAAAPGYRLTAYFIGPDYDLERNRFIDLLAIPGPDWLRHPWLGDLWVRPQSWSVSESNSQGGYAGVSVEFVHGGGDMFDLASRGQASPSPDRTDLAAAAIRTAADAAVSAYRQETMSSPSVATLIGRISQRLEVLRQAVSLSRLPLVWLGQVHNLIDGVRTDLAALMAVPGEYAAALQSLAHAFGLDAPDADLSPYDRPRVVAGLAAFATAAAAPASVPDEPALARNAARESALYGVLLASAAAGAALVVYQTAEDRDAALASALAAIDAWLPRVEDPAFQALADARAALSAALLAQDLAPTTTRKVVGPLPATVVAHRMEADEEALLHRHGIRHPLFVAGEVRG